MSEPTRAARVLDIYSAVFTERIRCQRRNTRTDHNQLQFNIKIKSDKTKVKQCRKDFRKGNYNEIRKSVAHVDVGWKDTIKNKTAAECWTILRSELDNAIDIYVPMKNKGNGLKRNIYQKRLSERLDMNKINKASFCLGRQWFVPPSKYIKIE